MAGVTVRKGAKIGSGGYSTVYRATEIPTGRIVALKQSRASLRLHRTLLKHESNVIKLLSGHPAIPEVYAHGRVEHFELLSMELLYCSLSDLVNRDGPLSIPRVLEIADQMLSALDHLSTHGLAHRDIKPSNIMLRDSESSRFCLIDFGLAYRVPKLLISNTSASASQVPLGVFGTLEFASLNAHDKKVKLAYRDDLESLGYTLIWLLRGDLPWTHYSQQGTFIGRIRQVYEQKKRLSGSRLAEGLPHVFGELVDHARSISADTKPNYGNLRTRLKKLDQGGKDALMHVPSSTRFKNDPFELSFPTDRAPRKTNPAKIGQIVQIKIDAAVTAEGYSIRAGHEASYIHDTQFYHPEWSTLPRPAIITRSEWDERENAYCLEAIPIARGLGSLHEQRVGILPDYDSAHTSVVVVPQPEWPFTDAFCFVFKRPLRFYCLPEQEIIKGTWKCSPADITKIAETFDPISKRRPDMYAKLSETSDIRHHARMCESDVKVFAEVLPLNQAHVDSIDWFSHRAWFDECVMAYRFHDLRNFRWWTGAWFPKYHVRKETDVSGSYMESDFEEWEPAQQERDASITLSARSYEPSEIVPSASATVEKIITLEVVELGET